MGAQQQAATTTTSTSGLEGVCVQDVHFPSGCRVRTCQDVVRRPFVFCSPIFGHPACASTRASRVLDFAASASTLHLHCTPLSTLPLLVSLVTYVHVYVQTCTCILKARCRRCAAVPNARVLAFACPYLSTYRCRNARTPAAACCLLHALARARAETTGYVWQGEWQGGVLL